MNNEANNIQKYIIAYRLTLENKGVEEIQVRTAKYNELNVSTITATMRNPSGSGRFWLESSASNYTDRVWYVNQEGSFGNYYSDCGVRPIIIIEY